MVNTYMTVLQEHVNDNIVNIKRANKNNNVSSTYDQQCHGYIFRNNEFRPWSLKNDILKIYIFKGYD